MALKHMGGTSGPYPTEQILGQRGGRRQRPVKKRRLGGGSRAPHGIVRPSPLRILDSPGKNIPPLELGKATLVRCSPLGEGGKNGVGTNIRSGSQGLGRASVVFEVQGGHLLEHV